MDHTTYMQDADGKRRIVTQPYGIDYKEACKIVDYSRQQGLSFKLSSWHSYWFPGRTIAVVWERGEY